MSQGLATFSLIILALRHALLATMKTISRKLASRAILGVLLAYQILSVQVALEVHIS